MSESLARLASNTVIIEEFLLCGLVVWSVCGRWLVAENAGVHDTCFGGRPIRVYPQMFMNVLCNTLYPSPFYVPPKSVKDVNPVLDPACAEAGQTP